MLFIRAVPALVALLSVVMASEGWTIVAAVALTVITVLALMSVGVFFVPTVVLAWIAVAASKRSSANPQAYRSAAE